MEQKIKSLLGEYMFTIMFLQEENEKLKKEIERLEDECKKPTKKQ